MKFFWKWRQQERENTEKEESPDTVKEERHDDMDTAITTISARLRFLEAITAELVAELPPTKRVRVLQNLRELAREQKIFPPPASVPPGKEQEYHDELRRAAEVLIENNEPKLRRP